MGFSRSLAIAAAIGTAAIADSYNIANNVPTMIFLLLGGGTVSAVFMPHLVSAYKSGPAEFEKYSRMLVWLGTASAAVITVGLLVTLPLYLRLFGAESGGENFDLTLAFALICIPQVLFLGIFAVVSQVLNAAGRFALVAWAPALSSVCIIAGCGLVVLMGGVDPSDPLSIDDAQVVALGLATLLGTVAQALILWIAMKRVGVRAFGSLTFRSLGLRATARAGLLTVAAAACYQVANLAVAAASARGGSAADEDGYVGRGYAAVANAQLIVYFAQAVVVMSVATVLMRRLSSHFADADRDRANHETNRAILQVMALVTPFSAALVVLGPDISEILFAHGATDVEMARYIGVLLAVLAVGLIPFSLHALMIRPFYAARLPGIPLYSAVRVSAVWIVGTLLALAVLPPEQVGVGVCVAFTAAYAVDVPLKLRALRQRLDFRLTHQVQVAISILGVAWVVSVGLGLMLATRLPYGPWGTAVLVGPLMMAVFLAITWRSAASLRTLFLRSTTATASEDIDVRN